METLFQDLRYSVRMLRKNPGFAAVAIITLALGIGANTAIFSVVDAVLLRPLPFADSDRLVWMGGWFRNRDKESGVTPADFLDYRDQSKSFTQLAASISDTIPMNLTGNGDPERLKCAAVTTNYLDVFGVKPLLGRTFLPDEGEGFAKEGAEGSGRVVVLSYSLWQRFGANPSIISQTVTLDGAGYTVIAVMPSSFQYPPTAELWKPISFAGPPQSPMKSRGLHFLRLIGKLKPGVPVAQAQAEVDIIARRLEAQYPKTNTDLSLFLMPLQEHIVGKTRLTLLLLLGAIGCVLLIACTNVANLLLARAASRQKEIAMRLALGASHGRIVRQMLTESLTLALLGGTFGAVLARWGVGLVVAFSAGNFPRADEIRINVPVLDFTLGISLLTGLLFGLAPALQVLPLSLAGTLKEAGVDARRGTYHNRIRSLLVVCEVALAFGLLIGAGLLVNSFARLQRVSPGFDEKKLLTVRIDLPNPYQEPEKKANFFEQLQRRVAALPGVEDVGLVSELPLARQSADIPFKIEDGPAQNPRQMADYRSVNHEYFRTMHIPLLRGRFFTEAEVHDNAKVVIISEMLARQFFPGEDPIGRHLRMDLASKEPFEIIAIVGDVRHRALNVDVRQTLYLPGLRVGWSNLVIRTLNDPMSLAAAVRKEVAAIDPNQPVANVKTMEEWVSESVTQSRFRTLLFSLFAIAALLLSVVGIYGVMSYVVTQCTHEIGIRMALGARTADVLRLVVGQGMRLALIGVVIGFIASFGLTRSMRSLLFGISATDPTTFVAIALLIATVALLASYVPARRASRVDPMVALRHD